ncbi:MAG: hypothetical protein J0M12_10085 [Deltaproteobacteria bacterium]|nr:hypothetical protein [Deltaproteobacteria bacterium]
MLGRVIKGCRFLRLPWYSAPVGGTKFMDTAFATLATRPLGPPRRRRSRRERRALTQTDPTPLATALTRAGVQHFTADSVAAYQCQVVADSRVRFRLAVKRIKEVVEFEEQCDTKDLFQAFMTLGTLLFCVGVFSVLTSAAAYGLVMLCTWGAAASFMTFPLLLGLNAGVAAVFVIGSVLLTRLRPKCLRDASQRKLDQIAVQNPSLKWSSVPLEQFTGTIPGTVREFADELLASSPAGTQLLVDHVDVAEVPRAKELRERARAYANDPFLRVRLGKEDYFVAVWDEDRYRVAWA